mmetsp:Transcript_122028/g.352617  ORF Transcript_122028/g.352617 Transcript_122028/m.352617 type:complete len:213 (+) Transcript_122028:133-771(+)|eukprot:CAMPEP_0176180928 /NCGR_PEP_ID=MMETSP0120_2-20121206/92705_1 /TAXON_ID=160619 /ORGANISM="Kryptoperidinium foliaceum, Strain CCMP 1326" /LENGTH=212 /DNA_ID=CAMNT_0017519143 /DNA_START=80 /DNA_END=718 /DNA_ORIENTATION=-
MAAAGKAEVGEVDYEALYQPTCVNVEGPRWERFGYILIACSTVIMVMQGIGLGAPWVWKRADDISTVLFTLELLMRVFEKGYLFFTEAEKHWNFFDSLVVAISLFSMVLAAKAQEAVDTQGHKHSGSMAMNKMKVLRTLRLLRLLRLFRVFKSVEKVNQLVDGALNTVGMMFVGMIVVSAVLFLLMTAGIAIFAAATSWLRVNDLPELPRIE